MIDVLLGASAMAAFCVALFFLRFWHRTRDAFHLCFAAAFVLIGVQRLVLAALRPLTSEATPAVYALRLSAYLLIIVAAGWKNLRRNVEPED
jgi:hypothetical protein